MQLISGAAESTGSVMIFLILNPDNPGNLKPEQFTLKHRSVITQMGFSPDHNWLVTGSADALMLWDMSDAGIREVDLTPSTRDLPSGCFTPWISTT